MEITWVGIAWVKAKSNSTPYFSYENDWRNQINTFGDF